MLTNNHKNRIDRLRQNLSTSINEKDINRYETLDSQKSTLKILIGKNMSGDCPNG